jgi:hypothetical protein
VVASPRNQHQAISRRSGWREDANIVGIHAAVEQSFEPGVGYRAKAARGVSASAFAAAAASAIAKNP